VIVVACVDPYMTHKTLCSPGDAGQRRVAQQHITYELQVEMVRADMLLGLRASISADVC
jgi:hypothetical protein